MKKLMQRVADIIYAKTVQLFLREQWVTAIVISIVPQDK